jgi:beta-glucosidase
LYEVSFDLTNTGQRKGAEVAQLYVTPAPSKVPRPKRELKAFARVELNPGETRHVTLTLDARSFAYFDASTQGWRAESGRYGIELARSADDIHAKTEITLPQAITVDVRD